MQLVTERAYPSARSLVFAAPEADGGRKVTNNLGVRVHNLLVVDEDGKLLSAGTFEAGKQGTLESLSAEEDKTAATIEFLKAFDEHAPTIPDGMDPYGAQGSWRWFGMGRAYYGGPKQFGTVKTGLEAQLAELRATISAGDLAPRTYVAIVDRPDEVSAGMDGFSESQSTHVILGTW
jgi:hypothetical protein